MKRILSFVLALTMVCSMLYGTSLNIQSEKAEAASVSVPYVTSGLVSYYAATDESGASYASSSTVWEDLYGDNDITVANNSTNYFTDEGYLSNGVKNYFPTDIVNTVNGSSFTMEILLGNFKCTGSTFSTFVNSSNDNFALFRRNETDNLEFKFAGVAKDYRSMVYRAQQMLPYSLITITYNVGGSVVIYINGVQRSCKSVSSAMGANDLFFGMDDSTKSFEGVFQSMRFYNRELSASEVLTNAKADGFDYVTDGLVSSYGTAHTDSYWTDTVSGYNVPVTTTSTSYYTSDGLFIYNNEFYFPSQIVNLVNGSEFTLEMSLGDFTALGTKYNTLINSRANDNFSFFRRVDSDVLEFKFAGNAQSDRPTAGSALSIMSNSIITITYRVGGSASIYVDGVLKSSVACNSTMGISDLAIGHSDSTKNFQTTFKSVKFYNRELSSVEVLQNAQAGGHANTLAVYGDKDYVTVAQPDTNVVGNLSLIRFANSLEELNEILSSSNLPSTIIFNVDSNLNVIDDEGNAFCTVAEAISKLKMSVIPGFYMKDLATEVNLVNYLSAIGYTDGFFVSDKPSVIKAAKSAYPKMSSAIDFTKKYAAYSTLSDEQIADVRKTLMSYSGTVGILPLCVCDQEVIQKFYEQTVNIWTMASDDISDTECYKAILSGAIGVISDGTDKLLAAARTGINSNTMTRTSINIAHRGWSSVYPDNTLEGSIAAYEQGANCVETDIYLSADNQIVIMHDIYSTSCNQTLNMETSTLAELKALYVNKGYEGTAYGNFRIPTLEEYFQYFQGKDMKIFIEIKSSKTEIVDVLRDLIDEYNMYDQCVVITFLDTQCQYMRSNYPEMNIGYLNNSIISDTNAASALRSAMTTFGSYNSSCNPKYTSVYNSSTQKALIMRGIGIYPWTFVNQSVYDSYFMMGYGGLTGNNCEYMANYDKYLTVTNAKDGDIQKTGSTLTVNANVTKYNRTSTNVSSSCSVKILEGSDIATVSGNKITFTGEGDVTFITSYVSSSVSGYTYTLYEQPVTIHVRGSANLRSLTAKVISGNGTVGFDSNGTTSASAKATQTAYFAVTPADNYKATEIYINDSPVVIQNNGEGSAVYSFEMPDCDVTISVVFEEMNPYVSCRDFITDTATGHNLYAAGLIDKSIDLGTIYDVTSVTFTGWFAVANTDIAKFGYSLDNGSINYDSSYNRGTTEAISGTAAAFLGSDIDSARFIMDVPFGQGSNIKVYAKDTEGNVYLLWNVDYSTKTTTANYLTYDFSSCKMDVYGLQSSAYLDTMPGGGYNATGLKMAKLGYNSAIYLGNIDLSQYESAVITYTTAHNMTANPDGAQHVYCLGLKSEGSSYGWADTAFNETDSIAWNNCDDAFGNTKGWYANERTMEISLDSDYSGPVYLTGYITGGNECVIVSLDLIPKDAENTAEEEPAGEYERGDFDMDGEVTICDAIALMKHILDKNYVISEEIDLTGDGIISSDDITAVIKHVLNHNEYPL